jgi:hypothetical protein
MKGWRCACLALSALAPVLVVPGCGSSKSKGSSQGGSAAAEAKSAATGDIPDNQVFLRFRNASAGYSILYPEGWARKGTSRDTTFQDKDNPVHVAIAGDRARPPRPGA